MLTQLVSWQSIFLFQVPVAVAVALPVASVALEEARPGRVAGEIRAAGRPHVPANIALGLVSGYAAFIASGEMAVAYFKAHAPRGFWPIMNFGELAALYSWLFLYIATRGSGSFSLDALFGRRR